MNRQDVYKLVDGERDYQDQKWVNDKTPSRLHEHSPEEWIMYMEDYLREAKQILSHTNSPMGYAYAMAIIRKVTAMGVAAMEQIETPARQS